MQYQKPSCVALMRQVRLTGVAKLAGLLGGESKLHPTTGDRT